MSAIVAARCSATRWRACWIFAGHEVTREYYINDAGAQSMCSRDRRSCATARALGEEIGEIPEGLYPGDYLKPVGEVLAAEHGDKFLAMPEAAWLPTMRATAIAMMMGMIKNDLAALNSSTTSFLRAVADRNRQQPCGRDHRLFALEGRRL